MHLSPFLAVLIPSPLLLALGFYAAYDTWKQKHAPKTAENFGAMDFDASIKDFLAKKDDLHRRMVGFSPGSVIVEITPAQVAGKSRADDIERDLFNAPNAPRVRE
jgi:hypothetical protein